MKKEHVVADRKDCLLKFDDDLWEEISDYIEGHYDKCSVEITRETGTEVLGDMDEAYEKICEYTDSIQTIKVEAYAEGELYRVVFKNLFGFKNRYNASMYCEAKNQERENDLIFHRIDILENHKVNNYAGYASYIAFMWFLIFGKEMFFSPIGTIGFVIMMCAVLLAAGAIYITGAHRIFQRLIFGKTRILFLTSYDSIAKYRIKQKINIAIGACILAAVFIGFVLYWIAA